MAYLCDKWYRVTITISIGESFSAYIWKDKKILYVCTFKKITVCRGVVVNNRAKKSHSYWLRTAYAVAWWERESLFGCFRYLSPLFVCVGLQVFNVRKWCWGCSAAYFYATVGRERNFWLQNRYQKFAVYYPEKLYFEWNQTQ